MYGAPGLFESFVNTIFIFTTSYFALQLLTNLSKLFLSKYANNNKCHLYGRILRAQFKLSPHNSFNCGAIFVHTFYPYRMNALFKCCAMNSLKSFPYELFIVCYKFTCVSRVCSFTHTTLIIRFWFDHIQIAHMNFVSSVASGAPQTCDIFTEH